MQSIIDILRGKKQLKVALVDSPFSLWKKNTKKGLKKIHQRLEEKQKIRVCFSVVYDSVFPSASLYEKMQNDDFFSPFILVIPDISRGRKNMLYQLEKTYQSLSNKYSHVYMSYDADKDAFIDWAGKMDLSISANPYAELTHELYSVEYLLKQKILSFFISYGYMPDRYNLRTINLKSMNSCWKVFTDTLESFKDYKKYSDMHAKNVVLSGYCKMDALAKVEKKPRTRKKILVCPHHSISMVESPLSNFLIYADFFQKLPKLYPEIDFIFRPHPLLYPTLCKENVWGEEKTKNYFEQIQKNTNLIYQNGGDYFDSFVNSDAMIHDCGSFLVEYMLTGHPSCYLLRDKKTVHNVLLDLGKNCLKYHYQAYNEQQILDFIDKVVVGENDILKEQRQKFVNQSLKINYPNVTEFIYNYLKENLK